MTSTDPMVIQWDLHEETRTKSLKNLWKDEDFLDVTLACDDGQVDAHKVILSASSTFFHKIFKRNLHNHPLLYLRGTRRNAILSLLDFIFSGETQISVEDLEDFMTIANSLEVKGLTGLLSGLPDFIKSTHKLEPSSHLPERLKEDDVDESPENNDDTIVDIKMEEESKDQSAVVSLQDQSREIISHNRRQFSCENCDYKSSKSNNVKQHILAVHEGIKFPCDQCDFKTGRMGNLRKHKVSKHDSVNSIVFVSATDETASDKTASDEATSGETVSDVTIENYSDMEQNAGKYDEKVAELVQRIDGCWKCSVCGYTSKINNNTKQHVERHIEGFIFACNDCGKYFSQKRTLRLHKYRMLQGH